MRAAGSWAHGHFAIPSARGPFHVKKIRRLSLLLVKSLEQSAKIELGTFSSSPIFKTQSKTFPLSLYLAYTVYIDSEGFRRFHQI